MKKPIKIIAAIIAIVFTMGQVAYPAPYALRPIASRAVHPKKGLSRALKPRRLVIASTKARDLEQEQVSIEEKLKSVLNNYNLGTNSLRDIQHEELPGGIPARKPLLIRSPAGNFVLKYAASNYLKARFVISAILRAYSKNIPVPLLHKKRKGGYLLKIGNWYYFLQDYIEGGIELTLDDMKPKHWVSLGRLTAHVHNALSGYWPKGRKREFTAIDIANAQDDFLNLRQNLNDLARLSRADRLFLDNADFIISQAASLISNLPPLKYRRLPRSILHGDMGISNIKWQQYDVLALFDWEKARSNQARIEEFKNALLAAGFDVGRKYSRENLISLLKAYQLYIMHKLTPEELEALPYILGPGTFLWDMVKWFILRKEELDTSDKTFEMAQRLIEEFRKIVDDFNKPWWQKQKEIILGSTIRRILKDKQRRQQMLVKELQDSDTLDAELNLMHLCLKATYKDPKLKPAVSVEERSDLLTKALAVSLKRKDAKDIAQFLWTLLEEQSHLILPEARMFIQSYLTVFEIKQPLRLAICISLYGGQMKYSDPPFGHGWLKTKTRQFFKELLSVNPNVEGIIVFVNDGDDSDPAARKPKTRDVIEGLLQDYYYRDIRDRFYVLEISQRDKLAMGSVKHGALAAGMRFALDKGADLVFYSDGDLSIPLGLCGLPVDSIVNKGNDLAFGSIRKKGRVAVNRRLKRKLGSFTFNWWVRSFHKPIRGIKDTQRSFKCFRKDALEKILPVRIISVDENGRLNITFESDFSYYFTGDIEWLGRARILGFKLDEIPIVWIDAPETTMLGWRDAPPMFINTYRVRDTLDRFRRKRSVFIGFEQAA